MPAASTVSPSSVSSSSRKGAPQFLVQLANEELAAQQIWANASDADEVASLLGESGALRKPGSKDAHTLGRKATMRAALAQAGDDDAAAALVDQLVNCSSEADMAMLLCDANSGTQLRALGDALEKSSLSDETRLLLERALDQHLQKPDWAVSFFAAVEFRSLAGMATADVAVLYDHAAGSSASLIGWFRELKKMKDRARKLKVMIHAMGEKLTEEGRAEEREHLSALIGTLKRMLMFLGIEQYCDAKAESMKIDGLDGDALLEIVLGMLEEDWFDEGSISEQYEEFQLKLAERIRYIRSLRSVLGLFPDPCFRDEDQRTNIMDIISECEDQLVVAELGG
jgi:type III secretion system TyeA family effector delivery regulator